MSDAVKETLDRFRQKELLLLAQLQSVRLTIKSLEQELGVQGDSPQAIEVPPAPSENGRMPEFVDHAPPAAPSGRRPQIREDEFFGLTQADAARRYLKKVGYAVTFDELAEALQAGGCKLSGANPKKVLYISLVRNTRDFVPPKPGLIGLREFYPGGGRVPKEKKVKPAKRYSRTRTNRKKAESKTKPKAAGVRPSQLAQVISDVMSDKQAHSVDELIKQVEAKSGTSVKKIGVFGVLRNKSKFEKTDGKYRLI